VKKTFNHKIKRYMYELFAGEYYATRDKDIALSTLLGSCVAVCLKDKRNGVVGMNHFMLPGKVDSAKVMFSEDGRYGINAMEKMVNDMMKLNSRRENMEAKVFGGGQVMDYKLTSVAQLNIEFALAYLEMEGIPIISQDVGGNYGRKLLLFPENFSVYMKRISYQKNLEEAVAREKKFLHWIRNAQDKQDQEYDIFNGREGKHGRKAR